ncbi:MAG: hypothetical protein HQL35_09625 [Alphaproteobacteria bacterium]|nr:hypothetical protein [Alphaproteobacteria bacterium]
MKLVLPLAAFLAALSPALSASAACPAPPAPDVRVELRDPEPRIVRTDGLNQINATAKTHGLWQKGSLVLGLTQGEVESSMNAHFQILAGRGGTCLNVTRVRAVFGNQRLDVKLPREYAPGSCQYDTVLSHEMAHVRVNREGVRKYAAILERELREAATRISPVHGNDQKDAEARAHEALKTVMESVGRRFESETHAQHETIDRPGGRYDAQGACRSW